MEYYLASYLGSFVFIYLLIWLPTAFFTSNVARSKDYNVFPWFLGGLFFGPIALISIAGMPDKKSKTYLRVIAEILDEMESVQQ